METTSHIGGPRSMRSADVRAARRSDTDQNGWVVVGDIETGGVGHHVGDEGVQASVAQRREMLPEKGQT